MPNCRRKLPKNCGRKSKTIELASAIVWNKSAIKIVSINLGYHGTMADHVSNSTLIFYLRVRTYASCETLDIYITSAHINSYLSNIVTRRQSKDHQALWLLRKSPIYTTILIHFKDTFLPNTCVFVKQRCQTRS